MIRSKGEAGTGNIVEAVRHLRSITRRHPQAHPGRPGRAVRLGQAAPGAPRRSCRRWPRPAGCPCPLFCAGGIATPADAALVMQLGAEAVFVGSGIFKSADPAPRAKAIVEATTHFRDAHILAKVSRGLGDAHDRHRHGRSRPPPGRPGLVGPMSGERSRPPGAPAHRRAGAAGRVRRARPRPRRPRRRRRRGPRGPTELDGVDAPGHARRRVDDDVDAARVVGPVRPPRQAAGRRPAGARDLRRHDPAGRRGARRPARPAQLRRHRPRPCAATPTAARSTASRPISTSPSWGRLPSTPCSSGPRSSTASGADVEVLAPRSTTVPCWPVRAPVTVAAFHPELSGDAGSTRASSRRS